MPTDSYQHLISFKVSPIQHYSYVLDTEVLINSTGFIAVCVHVRVCSASIVGFIQLYI